MRVTTMPGILTLHSDRRLATLSARGFAFGKTGAAPMAPSAATQREPRGLAEELEAILVKRACDRRNTVDVSAPLRARCGWQSWPSLLSEVARIAFLSEKVIPFLDGAVKIARPFSARLSGWASPRLTGFST